MLDVVMDSIIDVLKIFPFLFLSLLIKELIEHKFNNKSVKLIEKSGRFGPLIGGVLGCFPQCGFSVMATNLYVTRIITLGTLISVYLSTSDEMLLILISRGSDISEIIRLLGIKVCIGVISGIIIDFIFRKKNYDVNWELCKNEDCHCDDGIFVSSLKHTLHTLLFVMGASFLINIIMFYGGERILRDILGADNFIVPFVVCIIGLIPNCASSVILTELYLSGVLSFSNAVAGLLTGSGVALLVLFKSNKNKHENFKILLLVYFIGVISGLILNLLGF